MDSIRRWRAPSNSLSRGMAILFFLLILLSILMSTAKPRTDLNLSLPRFGCNFPAIFNFGDSNSDTGGKSAAFHRLVSPNGITFFGKPSERYSDGRVVLDFLAEKLGLPYLSAYLDSIGTNFQHGANFATGGSTIQPLDARIFEGGFSPISLDIQLSQFEQFKARTNELHMEARNLYSISSLPRPDDFAKALYTIDIGQNDLHAGLKSMTEKQLIESFPYIINQFAYSVEQLYKLGARAFWIHNTGPIGCLPYSLIHFPPKRDNMDQHGCIKSQNDVAQEFNRQLKDRVYQLRLQLPDAVLTYVDMYAAKYKLISEASKHGFVDPLGFCCGHDGNRNVQCGKKAIVNGTEVFGGSCSDPKVYISWDSIHYSDAANQWNLFGSVISLMDTQHRPSSMDPSKNSRLLQRSSTRIGATILGMWWPTSRYSNN